MRWIWASVSKTAPVVSRMKLHRAADVEGAVQRLLGAAEIPDPHVNLPQRRQRDAEAVRRAGLPLELDAALGQRQGLVVAMLQRGDVRLIAVNRRQDVASLHGDRQPLGMAHRDQRLLQPALLSQRDARQRVHHRQIPPIAGGVKGGGGGGEMLPDDGAVADLAVAEPELVVGQADRPRVVGALGQFQGFGQERDAA